MKKKYNDYILGSEKCMLVVRVLKFLDKLGKMKITESVIIPWDEKKSVINEVKMLESRRYVVK